MKEMSKRKQWVIIVAIFLIAGFGDTCSDDPRAHHQCPDTTHKTCDGRCECDGLECKVN